MQDFQGEGSDRLDIFFDHVEELADFYRWGERETCHQARAHLRGTALAYVKQAPFQPRCWEELKALLLKRFQPRDLTATYKAQFRSRRRRHNEDIHTFVEAAQRLADMAWPFMDSQGKEELVVDQFLLGMVNHELNVQVAAHGHRRIEDVLHVAHSLEAVHEEEKHAPRSRKPTTQARFVTPESGETTDTERVLKEILAQLGQESQRNRGGRRRRPTPGPKWERVRSAERKEVKPVSHTPSRDSRRGRSPSMGGRSRSRGEPSKCYKCKGFGHFAHYQVGPNGLPVRVRDPSRDSSQDSRPAKDKASDTKSLK